MPETKNRCAAQNGTYCCELTPDHTSPEHRSTFWSGQAQTEKRAYWTEKYGPMRFTRPAGGRKRFPRAKAAR
jgi:hypothetical protein